MVGACVVTTVNAAFPNQRWLFRPPVGRGDHQPEYGTFLVTLPDELWTRYVAWLREGADLEELMVAAAGLARNAPTSVGSCAAFRQDQRDPARVGGDRRCQTCGWFARDHADAVIPSASTDDCPPHGIQRPRCAPQRSK